MKYKTITTFTLLVMMLGVAVIALGDSEKPSAPNVDSKTGAISVPKDYTRWATLGTWAHANTQLKRTMMHPEGNPGSTEYHVVYTQPETIDYYKEHGRFPDGAVLVKELIHAETMPMTTGPAVSHATKIKGWFVLVRDTEDRFKSSKLWGEGWGWSLFNASDPVNTVSTDFQSDCLGCHVPARQYAPDGAEEADKWIYTLGYPVLQKK